MKPWRWFLVTAFTASSFASASDASERCVEEVAGVCIKYAPKRQLSDAERGEAALRLSAEDRKLVQRGLASSGAYRGGIDGALGAKSRQAIAIWQAGRGETSSGYLTALQFAALRDIALAAAPVAATPEPAPAQIEEPAAKAADTETALAVQPAPEPEPAPEAAVAVAPESPPAPEHPIAGRTYEVKTTRKRSGTPFEVTLRRTGENSAELKVRILGMHGGTLSKVCEIPIDSAFRCSKNRAGVRWTFTGQLPRVRVANDWGGDDVNLWP